MADSPTKKAKASSSRNIILLVLAGVGLLCLLAAVVIYFTVIRPASTIPPSVNSSNLPIFLDPRTQQPDLESSTEIATLTTNEEQTTSITIKELPTETTTSQDPEEKETTSTSSESQEDEATTTESSATTTTAFSPPLAADLIDPKEKLEESQKNSDIIEKCSKIEAKQVSCTKSTQDIRSLPSTLISPFHYALNLSILSIQGSHIEGNVQAFFRVNEETDQISINVDPKLRQVDTVHIINCDTGETICISKSVMDVPEELLSIVLSQKIPSGSNLRISFRNFVSSNERGHLYSAIPARWNMHSATIIGSLFRLKSARHIFPSFDDPHYKATVDLCLKQQPEFQARSNSDPLPDQHDPQIAFASFQRAELLVYNRTTIDGSYIPDVEVLFTLHSNFKREKHEWIYAETSKIIALMTKWSSFPYPLNKLSIVSAPIPMPGHSALGIITLKDSQVEYPSHTMTHETLMKKVISQWLGGIVSTHSGTSNCFEDALTSYLEAKLNENLNFIANRTRVNLVAESRPKNLKSESSSSASTATRRPPFAIPGASKCSPRFVEIFYSLDATFGENTVIGMLQEIMKKFAFSSASVNDWKDAVVTATNREEAGKILEEWFSRASRPVIQATVTPQKVEFRVRNLKIRILSRIRFSNLLLSYGASRSRWEVWRINFSWLLLTRGTILSTSLTATMW
ncbi:hypothetical protein WR25_02611 isoform G [Diploscapter pachys]|uniref:Aminopeptidase N-like N-terminal domain-containing protein n=1 Tax=Diploscapter pachys TaxID=2018661 RepID=A0A2A2LAN3_9BILA|nr:hypothetical protein WR25_02611 isoform A [Diploscapter pachys]PAV83089.1 hypothetical protein WR25_02611 isoform C [Diploscapter pachys]PAV83090.1 hypothetical protein WR25_02611 isoform D [Diploscapter pachys]PAV83093.1 hypothetical protein WR25_02611 isoform G [Diploscapter pachys]